MAAIASLRVPLVASIKYPVLRSCPRARLAAQLPSRIPKTIPARTGFRTFRSSAVLQEKRYTEDHEWIELAEDEKTGTMGISVYAADALGDVVYVELPPIGMEVGAVDNIGSVESVKSASDIKTPMSGKIIEVNEMLQEKPGTINKEPEGGAWIAKLEITHPEEFKDLMDAAAYKAFTEE